MNDELERRKVAALERIAEGLERVVDAIENLNNSLDASVTAGENLDAIVFGIEGIVEKLGGDR